MEFYGTGIQGAPTITRILNPLEAVRDAVTGSAAAKTDLTGSIAWAGAMAWNRYDNHIARITANVLRRFLDPRPFRVPPEL